MSFVCVFELLVKIKALVTVFSSFFVSFPTIFEFLLVLDLIRRTYKIVTAYLMLSLRCGIGICDFRMIQ